MSSKSEKYFNAIVKKMSQQLQVEKELIFHFLNADLEKVYNEKLQMNTLELTTLKTKFYELNKKETELKNEIETATKEIERLGSSIGEKSRLLADKQKRLEALTQKLKEVEGSLKLAEKELQKTDYNLLMKKHSLKAKTDRDYKYISLLLTIFALAGIVVALLIVKFK